MNLTRPVAAIDIGHSAVKVRVAFGPHRESLSFRSVVTDARPISEDAARKAAERETVTVRGRRLFFGETAILQGGAEIESGMSEAWITTQPHMALFLAALKKLKQLPVPVDLSGGILCVGLPAKFYAKQREMLISILQPHVLNTEIVVFPQPLGPFFSMQYNEDGTENRRRDLANESWAIIEVGHFTTDYALLKNGTWIERGSGSSGGAAFVADQLAKKLSDAFKVSITPLEATDALVAGHIKLFGDRVPVADHIAGARQAFMAQVMDQAEYFFDKDVRGLDGILVAGGGADLVKESIAERWKCVVDCVDSRFAVAEGFLRAGLALSRIGPKVPVAA